MVLPLLSATSSNVSLPAFKFLTMAPPVLQTWLCNAAAWMLLVGAPLFFKRFMCVLREIYLLIWEQDKRTAGRSWLDECCHPLPLPELACLQDKQSCWNPQENFGFCLCPLSLSRNSLFLYNHINLYKAPSFMFLFGGLVFSFTFFKAWFIMPLYLEVFHFHLYFLPCS